MEEIPAVPSSSTSSRSGSLNGTPDSTFGINGIARADFFGSYDSASAAIQQGDGKVVLAGFAIVGGGTTDIALARFRSDGTLDPTFDGDGKATLNVGGTNEYAIGLALQPGGKLVVAGRSDVGGNNRAFFARYDVRGTLNVTFGNGGLAFADFGDAWNSRSMTLRSRRTASSWWPGRQPERTDRKWAWRA